MFHPGDQVTIHKLRKNGVVVAVEQSGKVRVAVGSVTIKVPIEDLSLQESKASKKLRPSSTSPLRNRAKGGTHSIDLHGLNSSEAKNRVEQAINDAVLAGVDRLEIVHGKGTGTLKKMLHELLPTLPAVERFSLDTRNPGATIVHL